jgi:acetoin utilization deacetylase AcuC-like enzyme
VSFQTRLLKFVTDPLYAAHLRGVAHPERPDRVEAVAARLRERNVLSETLAARDARDEELERVHSASYIELVERETAGLAGARYLSTGDTVVDASSAGAARRAAGGALVAAERAAADNETVFALVRPPGHHAEPDRGMGFCLFNNVAVAARALQAQHGVRVLVVDFDYHHGNGTEAIAGDGLSYCSTHAHPAYPGTGTRSYWNVDDFIANVPLPVTGISTEGFVAVWERLLPMVAQAARPDVLLVSAGFDYVAGDEVGDLGVAVAAAHPIAAAIQRVADEHCDGRVAYVLEGGYGLEAIADSIAAIAAVADRDGAPSPSGADAGAIPPQIKAVLDTLSRSRKPDGA